MKLATEVPRRVGHTEGFPMAEGNSKFDSFLLSLMR